MSAQLAPIRIGCASAFWGDTETAAKQLIDAGQLNYLVFDYLAEITMAIMAGQKARNPESGFAADFVQPVLTPLLAQIKQQGIKVVSNAGGINPQACASALQEQALAQNLSLSIAVVDGDDLISQQQRYRDEGRTDMFSGQMMPEHILSMNAYLGAEAITKALTENADIVITGRIVDSAVVLAPLLYEFGWSMTDYDRLAQACLAGHIIECGTQCTGGNFTDWQQIKGGYANMGFPIVEIMESGDFIVTKPPNTGGMVSCATVAEQIVYEIDDPNHYQLPDVICDFSDVQLTQSGEDKVAVTGAKGQAPSNNYKVSVTYLDGFKCTVSFLLSGLKAKAKAAYVSEAIIEKTETLFKARGLQPYTGVNIELLGSNATYNPDFFAEDNAVLENIGHEIVVKISVTHPDKNALTLFSREIAQAATAMAPGITGLVGGRPSVTPKISLFSMLVPKQDCQLKVTIADQQWSVAISTNDSTTESTTQPLKPLVIDETLDDEVPLILLAWARSGDKGDHCNIGVISRKPVYLKYIEATLSDEVVANYFSHVLSDRGKVKSWRLPGLSARNYLLRNSLGGGGISSLRIDPQGKAFAQQLLQYPIRVPAQLAKRLRDQKNVG